MKEQIAAWKDEITTWRRDIHKHPELAFEEHRTADFVAEKLASFGLDVHRGLAGTGVVGTLRAGDSERAIALRADMDALPIQENNEFEYRSVNANKMHACGHDGHTAMLLGAAKYLAATRNFNGTVHFIFQPAEEAAGGGLAMIEDGLFEKFPVDSVYGMHNWPGLAVGKFGVRTGSMMASFDTFDIEISGVGAHAALPHTGVDPVMVAGQLIGALQTIVSRNADPIDASVISVTRVEAGDAYNVIPEKAVLRGCSRALNADTRIMIERRIREIATSLCEAFSARCEVTYANCYPVLVNTAAETDHAVLVASQLVGSDNVNPNHEPTMGSEDFAYMLEQRPGCYIFIGNGDAEGTCMVHNAGYDFNDDAIETGVAYWCSLTESLLAI
jgi:amidohydrolase